MVIKSVALYTTPRKVCNSIVQKGSCWFQWGLEQSHTQRVFAASQTIPGFEGMMKLKLQIIRASAMGEYQLHLLDQGKSTTKGVKFGAGCALLAAHAECPQPVLAPSRAAHPCLPRAGTRAWSWAAHEAASTAGRGKRWSQREAQRLQAAFKRWSCYKQTNSCSSRGYLEGGWVFQAGGNACGRKKAFSRSENS